MRVERRFGFSPQGFAGRTRSVGNFVGVTYPPRQRWVVDAAAYKKRCVLASGIPTSSEVGR